MASTVGRVEDLVVKDGEVQRKTEADGVRRRELSLGNIGSRLCAAVSGTVIYYIIAASYLVCLVCGSCSNLALLSGRELGEVAVVVTLPVMRGMSATWNFPILRLRESRGHTSCGRRPWTRQTRPWG
jgi:hypothetical protein